MVKSGHLPSWGIVRTRAATFPLRFLLPRLFVGGMSILFKGCGDLSTTTLDGIASRAHKEMRKSEQFVQRPKISQRLEIGEEQRYRREKN